MTANTVPEHRASSGLTQSPYDLLIALTHVVDDEGFPAVGVDIMSKQIPMNPEAPAVIIATWFAENFTDIVAWAKQAHEERKAAQEAKGLFSRLRR